MANMSFQYDWEKVNVRGTESQVSAIRSEKTLTVVSAGAGTGKTQTLSQRFAWLLSSDRNCKIDEILVLTFTEKAAREMRDRIESTLVEWSENSPSELQHLKRHKSNIEEAQISTIHSFAMKVIRESGLVLDIDPMASIVTAPREEIWWQTFADSLATLSDDKLKNILTERVWLNRCDELFNNQYLSDLVSFCGPEKLAEMSKSASEKYGSYGKEPEDIWNQGMDNLLEDIQSKNHIYTEIWDLWQLEIFSDVRVREELEKNSTNLSKLLKDLMMNFTDISLTDDKLKSFARELVYVCLADLRGTSNLKKRIEELLEPHGYKALTSWREEAKKKTLMASEPTKGEAILLSLLNKISAIGWQCWENLRKKEGVLTHNDLIRYAGDVLVKNKFYGKRFKHILVDEFQDTDILQEKLIRALWDGMDNTLFVVGDIKQSIYRFRHADLSIFKKYIEESNKNNKDTNLYLNLDRNFRTHDLLLEEINHIFGSIWNDVENSVVPCYEALLGLNGVTDWWDKRNSNPIKPIIEFIIAVEKRDLQLNEKGKEQWIRAEKTREMRIRCFKELACYIEEIHKSGTQIWDKKLKGENKFRDVMWKDFAVLVPGRNMYSLLENAFDEMEIPYTICTAKDYFARGEVADIINLISLLNEPTDPYYLLGWISSPFSGVSHEMVDMCIHESYKRQEKYESIKLDIVVQELMPQVWEKIQSLKAIAELRSVAEVIYEVLKSPDYLKAYEPNTRRRVIANIVMLADLANEYESTQGRSLSGVTSYLQFSLTNAKRKEEPNIFDEEQDAVQIMTIHASKGLEFPIVILTDIEKRLKSFSGIQVSLRYGVLSTSIPDFLLLEDEKANNTVSGAWFVEAERVAELAERERLWYVANTRAREKLILCGTLTCNSQNELCEPNEDSFLRQLINVDKVKLPKRDQENKIEENTTENGSCKILWLTEEHKSLSNYKKKIHRHTKTRSLEIPDNSVALARLSASAYAMYSWCPKAYRLQYRQGIDLLWNSETADGVGGSIFGSLTHWFINFWDFRKESLESLIPDEQNSLYENLVKRLPLEFQSEFKSSKIRRKIRKILSHFADSAEGKEIELHARENKTFKQEIPFRVKDRGLLLVGAIDALWEDNEAVHIRDWKTTEEKTSPSEYYSAQLDFYAYAIWKYRLESFSNEIEQSKKPVVVGINYLNDLDEKNETKRVLDIDHLQKIGNNIDLFSREALSDEFLGNVFRCEKCPWSEECQSIKNIKS